ncbi:hypothetical protein BDQ12DRAFT_752507 [Crucibulum laeve]|uniref:DH domain-containing protein n=1 Tax=Crucibulum laeve TaxID=68775 RepID=A0A5C3MH79_9AGAR|nr:hypothetical protein BDQ12DRAFT_752507 [Crucibulum laeve]
MALSSSPRKVVPLATGDEPRPRSIASHRTVTKRVFYCGVVVEGSEGGKRLPDEIQELVLSLGSHLDCSDSILSSTSSSFNDHDRVSQRKRALTDTSALSSVINELVTSERSYVRRLQILKNDYADPLRSFARSKETAIIPAYEAKTLFGNVDNLIPVNEAFLTDLEKMMAPNGARTVGGVGDVLLRHFKDLRGFEHYKQYYVKREEAQAIFEREVSKRASRFSSYIDHIKYQSTDPKNRIGLRELLMEPVQRIPRYTLLFRTMLKHMAPEDPQRAKIMEADDIASKIALAEADEQTKRATIFYCLSSSIDGFPADLFSNSRRFIDCIDVEDIVTDTPLSSAASSTSQSATALHCTLFLFDDKLMIVKRPGNGEKGGKVLSGLDDLEKSGKVGGIPTGRKKSGMTCKGIVDVTEVVATDVGDAEINLYLENPPQDQTDRWSGRPFRSLSVVNPPMPINLDPTQTEVDKQRFLENLWHVQATYRARAGQSVVLRSDEQEVECRSGKITLARTYFNVYQRSAFLQEQKKTKIIVHIDPLGTADPIPFGLGGPPFARIKVQPLAGGLCRYAVTSSDPADEGEDDIVQTERVPFRVVQTIHQYGLFEFKTGKNSLPSTPTARSRVAIFGLDAISRNLFNTRPGSTVSDFFGGSINGRRRTKSITSRSSTYTQTTTTGDGSLGKLSHRSNSTAATTMMTMDDDTSFFGSQSSRGKKRSFRGKSPAASDAEGDYTSTSSSRAHSLSRSSSTSRDRYYDQSDAECDDTTIMEKPQEVDPSDLDLSLRLELARKNSMSQHEKQVEPLSLDIPVEDTIYEEEPPQPIRSSSRASGDTNSYSSTIIRSESPSKYLESPSRPSRSLSRNSGEHRLFGPRSPSPLPSKSPRALPALPSMDDDLSEESFSQLERPVTPIRSQPHLTAIPRSIRQPLFPTGNTDTTPKPTASSSTIAPSTIEPLSIKKKTSLRDSVIPPPSPTVRKTYTRNSPLSRTAARIVSPRRVSPQIRRSKLSSATQASHIKDEDLERILHLSVSTKDDIESSRRSIKRIKIEIDSVRACPSSHPEDPYSRPGSPEKGSRTPQATAAMARHSAQDRMEEMRQLIGRRQGEGTPIRRPVSTVFSTPTKSTPVLGTNLNDLSRSVDGLVSDANTSLLRALTTQETLQGDLQQLATTFREKITDLERTRVELQNAKRQCEVVKSLLADVTAEKDIMYEAFNEELDGMFNDANLPDDEAWLAMSKDLRQTKESRNALTKENSQLRQKLAEVELQREEWGELLRAHGLIP